ncbi:hypothetical protein [Streptomyces broussonetiae]|uniref:MbtH family NRPS accessory protein n=1 Tax=Streptomyces broussonetiae TaxID=2686304 RepID=A0ABV5E5K5_9ACTN
MSGPSSAPRGERAPAPGVTWNTELVPLGEVVVDCDGDESPFGWTELPKPNRETRRAMQRAARRKK